MGSTSEFSFKICLRIFIFNLQTHTLSEVAALSKLGPSWYAVKSPFLGGLYQIFQDHTGFS